MVKFCGKCGAKLDEATGLCPNCDADKLNKQTAIPEEVEKSKPKQDTTSESKKLLSKKEAKKQRKADKKAAKKAKKKEKRAKLTTGQMVRRFFLKMFLGLVLFIILAAGSCGLMVYYGFLDIPIVDELVDEIGVISYSEFAGQDINESYIPYSENIVYQNENNSFGYVNNMILVFFNSSVAEEEINEAVNSVNGKIIGRIAGINQYQIQVEPMEREELDAVCEFLMENENVKYAIIDTVITMDSNVIPNDPWKDTFQGLWGVDWDENNPDGYNWWIEAVKVPSAWEYNDVLNSVNVGIVDNGFDTNHEDLNLTVLNSEVNNAENHGTHVAGVIGAEINNEVGISGILSKKNLYCVDCYATSKQKKSNIAVSSLMDGIVTCLDNNCKVINMSSGTKFTSKDETAESAKESARYATIYLFAMLDSYDDFIIVQSAGNGNKAGVGVDAHKYTGYFASIDDNIIQSVLDEFKEKEVVLNRDITAEDVKNAYIIVGAMDVKKKKDNWQLSEFSNYGNALTICAPGVDVFSTTVSGGIDGSYGNMDGTSMAAPIVSGIVAMVWSVDPTVSSEQVQTYITDTATEVVLNRNKNDSGTYYLVNANEAVKAAISDLDGVILDETMGVKINDFMPDESDLGTVHSEGSMTSIIDANGNLIMCGLNADGQLGSEIPEKKSTYSLVSTDIKYACGTSNLAVISKDDKLYVRKYDGNEPLPNEKNVDLGMYKVADEVMDVEVWGDVCAYVTNDGELYAMGSPRGSFGDSGNTIWSAEPIKIMDNIRDIELSTNYDYGTTFAAITKENELYMWGNNSSGIIRESIEDDVSKPLLIMENVKMVSLGKDYVLVLTMDNMVYAWGNNKHGQLGIGSTDDTEEVVKIMEDVVYVDAGTSSSLAVTKNGDLYTWGSNNRGCAGVGVDYDEEVEMPVAIMENVRTASIDDATMIILDNDGNVYTCGWNSEGQLGTGAFNDSNVPIKVYNIYESDLPGTLSDENELIELDNYINSFEKMVAEIGGNSTDETGDHENWIIKDDALQYGNYYNSSSVDEIVITSNIYSVYGIHLNQNLLEVKNTLLLQNWNIITENSNHIKFKHDNINLALNLENQNVSSITFWRSIKTSDEKTSDSFQNETDIGQDGAIKMAREKFGDSFSYICSASFEYNGTKYYVVDVKAKVDNHYSRMTQVLVAADGSSAKEGYYNEGGQPEFYE